MMLPPPIRLHGAHQVYLGFVWFHHHIWMQTPSATHLEKSGEQRHLLNPTSTCWTFLQVLVGFTSLGETFSKFYTSVKKTLTLTNTFT